MVFHLCFLSVDCSIKNYPENYYRNFRDFFLLSNFWGTVQSEVFIYKTHGKKEVGNIEKLLKTSRAESEYDYILSMSFL